MNALIYWFIGIQNTTQVYLLHSVDYFQKKLALCLFPMTQVKYSLELFKNLN